MVVISQYNIIKYSSRKSPFGISNQDIERTPTSVPAATTGGNISTGNPSCLNKSSFHWNIK